MPYFVGGGSAVGSAEITDGAIVDADVNASAAIAQTKLAGAIDADTDIVKVEVTSGTTHALTTVAGQRVVVLASFTPDGAAGIANVNLKYNGVTKHTMSVGTNNDNTGMTLMYTEVPGAATQNITVDASAGTIGSCVIMVFKIK